MNQCWVLYELGGGGTYKGYQGISIIKLGYSIKYKVKGSYRGVIQRDHTKRLDVGSGVVIIEGDH